MCPVMFYSLQASGTHMYLNAYEGTEIKKEKKNNTHTIYHD